jgi:hypothetical protein
MDQVSFAAGIQDWIAEFNVKIMRSTGMPAHIHITKFNLRCVALAMIF